jgi:Planctomycete cytochrome C
MARQSRPAAAPTSPPFVEPIRRRRSPLIYLFGAIYVGMLIAGFAIGLRAGSPKPTTARKAVTVAEHKPKSSAKSEPEKTPPESEPVPKAKEPEHKEEPKAKEPDPMPMPEATPEKKTEPKMEKPEPKKPEPKPEPKPPVKTEPKKGPNLMTVVTFNKILPIFKDKCINCHGGASKKGELDLRDAKAAIKGGESGAGLVPNDPEKSLIWQQINDGTMPPKNKPKLTADEKKLIKDWIAGGAK